MLLLQGGRDYNVTTADFAEWRAAIGAKTTVTMKTYPSLNHIFVAGTGPITPAEYNVAAFMDEEVVRDVAEWILGR
jgi:alpha-beta hydrolase superfamily lysophospholipase